MAFREKMSNAHPLLKGVLWLGIMALLFVASMVGYVLYVQLTGLQSVMALKMAQLVQSLLVFVVPALLAVWCWSRRPAEWLRLQAVGNGRVYALVVLLMIVAQPGINMLATWNEGIRLPAFMSEIEQYFQDMEASARELTEMLAAAPTIGTMLLNLVVLAAVPAIGEELSFRGVLLGLIDGDTTLGARISPTRRTHIAVWVVGIIFSLIHFQFYGFIPRMLLGVVLGYLLVWTGSLWVPMVAHFTNNALVVLLYFAEEHFAISSESLESFGTGTTSWAGWLSILLSLLLLWIVRNAVQKRSSAPHPANPAGV
ncbi:MAG: CPBP family intramembrane metalloprotease [Bacteroidales bacterium]|nr:CPBP family intramembrane metalloprotease [Bacteroidales bacterium]